MLLEVVTGWARSEHVSRRQVDLYRSDAGLLRSAGASRLRVQSPNSALLLFVEVAEKHDVQRSADAGVLLRRTYERGPWALETPPTACKGLLARQTMQAIAIRTELDEMAQAKITPIPKRR